MAAFRNSDDDLQMMQWTAAGNSMRHCVRVHHTDGDREWAYDRNSSIGRFDKWLDEVKAKGWMIVDYEERLEDYLPIRTSAWIIIVIGAIMLIMINAKLKKVIDILSHKQV
jgi:hypothetical protein